jgi:hypothetical protein
MRIRLILLIMILAGISTLYAGPFPTTFTIDSLNAASKNIAAWNGKIISISGRVDSIATAYQNRPYIHVVFRDPNLLHKGIWINWITDLAPNKLRRGDMVAVLGYFAAIAQEDKRAREISQQAYHMVGYCMANATNKEGAFPKEAQSQWEQWMNGAVPTSAPAGMADSIAVTPVPVPRPKSK